MGGRGALRGGERVEVAEGIGEEARERGVEGAQGAAGEPPRRRCRRAEIGRFWLGKCSATAPSACPNSPRLPRLRCPVVASGGAVWRPERPELKALDTAGVRCMLWCYASSVPGERADCSLAAPVYGGLGRRVRRPASRRKTAAGNARAGTRCQGR